MTNSYDIIRAIAKVDGMSYAEKFAGKCPFREDECADVVAKK